VPLERGNTRMTNDRAADRQRATRFFMTFLSDAAVSTSTVEHLAASPSPGAVAVDIGSGHGRDIALLRARGFRVIGVDLSLGQLRTSSLADGVQADMRQLSLRGGSVDAIWRHAACSRLQFALHSKCGGLRPALSTCTNPFQGQAVLSRPAVGGLNCGDGATISKTEHGGLSGLRSVANATPAPVLPPQDRGNKLGPICQAVAIADHPH
jgi:SAM-dependent methyltransferase